MKLRPYSTETFEFSFYDIQGFVQPFLTIEISIQKCQMIVKFNIFIILLTTMQGS